jgi:SAM-dependent methyltransferase
MQNWKEFAREAWRERWRIITNRFQAAQSALKFQPKELANYHFHRYVNYRRVEEKIKLTWGEENSKLKVIEFGGSNGVILGFFKQADLEVAPNFPEVDIQDLKNYSDKTYDVVILDQILEHIPNPEKAVREVMRVLKPEGVCICITPFLIKIHGYPDDYFRYTDRGLKRLFSDFGQVEVKGWGNRYTLEIFHRYGWLSARNAKRTLNIALWNEPEYPIEYLTWAQK